jgi:HEPN domain-containing protein
MINTADLMIIAQERLNDAEVLLNANRYNSAVYLCGYSIEIALKYKICVTLNWTGFPSTGKEFDKFKSLKTHDLDVLLSFTGIETHIKAKYLAEWSAISTWNPESRYNPTGTVNSTEATLMINSAKILIEIL